MKNFRITVNGNTYDVAVEELGAGAPSAAVSTPVPPASVASAAPSAPSAPSAGSAEGTKVVAPMPGNILDIKVSVGQKVDKNAVVAILEAMKMENEIVTPVSGTVAAVNVTKGNSVNSGDVLITIAE